MGPVIFNKVLQEIQVQCVTYLSNQCGFVSYWLSTAYLSVVGEILYAFMGSQDTASHSVSQADFEVIVYVA